MALCTCTHLPICKYTDEKQKYKDTIKGYKLPDGLCVQIYCKKASPSVLKSYTTSTNVYTAIPKNKILSLDRKSDVREHNSNCINCAHYDVCKFPNAINKYLNELNDMEHDDLFYAVLECVHRQSYAEYPQN